MVEIGDISIYSDYEGNIKLLVDFHKGSKYDGLEGVGDTLHEALEDLMVNVEMIPE